MDLNLQEKINTISVGEQLEEQIEWLWEKASPPLSSPALPHAALPSGSFWILSFYNKPVI